MHVLIFHSVLPSYRFPSNYFYILISLISTFQCWGILLSTYQCPVQAGGIWFIVSNNSSSKPVGWHQMKLPGSGCRFLQDEAFCHPAHMHRSLLAATQPSWWDKPWLQLGVCGRWGDVWSLTSCHILSFFCRLQDNVNLGSDGFQSGS